MTSTLGISPLLKPLSANNKKWLEKDPLELLDDQNLDEHYQELLEDKEIYNPPKTYLNSNGDRCHRSSNGNYYCGQVVLDCTCCNNICGPAHGCSCKACLLVAEQINELDIDESHAHISAAEDHLEAWTWGKVPTLDQLKSFSKLAAHKQLSIFKNSLQNDIFLKRLKSRIYVYARILSVYSKTCFSKKSDEENELNTPEEDEIRERSFTVSQIESEKDFLQASVTLTLKFTFKYIRETLLSGQNVALCSELLQESVDLFDNIPKICLFQQNNDTSSLFQNMIGETFNFFFTMMSSNELQKKLETKDKKNVVLILLEMSFQCGSLPLLLRTSMLCTNLKENGILNYVPAAKFIKKLANHYFSSGYVPEIIEMHLQENESRHLSLNLQEYINNLDEDLEVEIDDLIGVFLKIIMCIIQPYKEIEFPKEESNDKQDVLVWGSLKLLTSLKEEATGVKIATICCSEQMVVILTLDGKMLCGKPDDNKMNLKPYEEVADFGIVDITCSFTGHFIGLAKFNKIFTWFDDNENFTCLSSIPLNISAVVVNLYAGYNSYAVLTSAGELCLWDQHLSGRATNDVGNMQFSPRVFEEFDNSKIVDIALSQYHSEVLIVTKKGKIWLLENNTAPKLLVDEDLEIKRVCIAKYFYVALSSNGQVWRWGRDRFNKAYNGNMVYMQSVEKLNKENVLSISVGGFHCIALTQSYNVFCWGGLGGKEEDESLIREPVLLKNASDIGISKLVAGPHQIFCWSVSSKKKLEDEIPFCVNITNETFEMLCKLISKNMEENKSKTNLISYLEILKLQFLAARNFKKSLPDIFIDKEKDLLTKLKEIIMKLIISDCDEVCKLAEQILSCGWVYLLPTAKHRARTLSDLLIKSSEQKLGNQKFIMKLLFTCLLEENGLEELIEATFNLFDDSPKKKNLDISADTQSILLKEIFLAATKNLLEELSNTQKPAFHQTVLLDVLLKYQRLLFARIFVVTEKDICWPARCYVFDLSPSMKLLLSMLNVYITLLLSCCKQILTCNINNNTQATVILSSPIGVLFQEFIVYLIILQNFAPVLAVNCDCIPQLAEILDLLDIFNKKLTILHDGASENSTNTTPCDDKKKVDEEKKVETSKEIKTTNVNSSDISTISMIEELADNEVSAAIVDAFSCNQSKELVLQTLFGNQKKVISYSLRDLKQILIESECMLSFFLGLHCCYLAHGMYPSQDEVNNKKLIMSQLFKGGIVKQMVMKDKNTPPPTLPLIGDLISEAPSYKSRMLLKYFYIQAEKEGMMIIPNFEKADEQLERSMYYLLATFILHCGLPNEVTKLQTTIINQHDKVKQSLYAIPLTKPFKEIVKFLLQIRMEVLKKHQETGDTYEDLCKCVIANATFLCLYLTPTLSYNCNKENWINVIQKVGGCKNQHRYLIKFKNDMKDYYEKQKIILKDIQKFVLDSTINLDVLRKCFLMEVKRAKQRLISGYLMQSLTLRQSIYLKAQFSLQLGWLGLLSPGGIASGPKPGVMYNVELIPKDDVTRMHEVFKGVETFAIKEFFDRCDTIKKLAEEQDGISGYVKRSGKYLLMYITLFGSSLMSGDVDFLIQCGILEKIQYLLTLVSSQISRKKQNTPFIDPFQKRKTELEELSGPIMAKLMKVGVRVVRGADWKWEDQDGPSPSQGRIVSELGDDGWIRVEWDTGFRNSYRMGKNGKYDLQIVDKEATLFKSQESNNDLFTDTEEEVISNTENDIILAALNWLTINVLNSVAISDELLSEYALNHITKFFIQVYKDLLNCASHKWCSGLFGFLRSLCASQQICDQISCNDWIDLVMKLFDLAILKHDEYAGAEALFVKVQLVRQLMFMVKIKDASFVEGEWKMLFVKNLFKSVEKLLFHPSLFLTNDICNTPLKSSLTATVHATVIEELVQLIRYLSTCPFWCDIVQKEVMIRLQPSCFQNIFQKNIKQNGLVSSVAALCVIAGLDDRVRIGSCVNHGLFGRGIVKFIKTNGKLLVQYGGPIMRCREASLNQVQLISEHEFNMNLLYTFQDDMHVIAKLVDLLLEFPTVFAKTASSIDLSQEEVIQVQVYVSTKRFLSHLMQNKAMFLSLFMNFMKSRNSKFMSDILEKSTQSSQIQSGYNDSDLEIAALSLIQYISSDTQRSSRVKPSVLMENQSTNNQENEIVSCQNDTSHHLVQLLSAMGFPQTYIQHALQALGESTRPEQIVSWLLEHPDDKFLKNESSPSSDSEENLIEEEDDDDDVDDSPDEISDIEPSDVAKLYVGCTVESLKDIDQSIIKGDIGVILKMLYKDGSGLVYWQRLNFSVWVLLEHVKRIAIPKSTSKFALGDSVHLNLNNKVHDITPDQVGIVIDADETICDIYFEKNVFLKEKFLKISHVERNSFCGVCRKKKTTPLQICNICHHYYLCQSCAATEHHPHNLLELSKERCRPRHDQAIKRIKVSSNQHFASRMINDEVDLSWEPSITDKEPWLLLHLHKNVLIRELSLSLDPISSLQLNFEVFCKKKNGKYDLVDQVSGNEPMVKLLLNQDEIFSEVKILIKKENSNDAIKVNRLHLSCMKREPDYDQQIFNLFKNIDPEPLPFTNDLPSGDEYLKCRSSRKQLKVFCWGLNDKDQLAGLKGSKIKSAVISESLSILQCKDFVGGSKTLFFISQTNRVFACGETTNGRLGLGDVSCNIAIPKCIEELSGIKKVAVHPGGRHALALTFTGEVYSWGEGDDGKLGHGNTTSYDTPKLIEALQGKFVTDIACGSSHNAAIVDKSQLYTWGLGDYGRLGHGDELTQLEPKLVISLEGYKVVTVACGSRDAQTVCVTEDGNVWSWGDGDFGKLGRGGSDGCSVPMIIEKLRNKGICKLSCGAQFTLALSTTGLVWTWGKGDFYRLGHGSDAHVREPMIVEALKGKNIVDVAVGALHCLAVTEEGEIYAWGDNDHGQQGTGTVIANKYPTRVLGTEDYRIKRVACGSSHSLAWAEVNPTLSILEKPLEFASPADPLGSHEMYSLEDENEANVEKFLKEHKPSLTCSVLELSSKKKREEALVMILGAVDIRLSRDLLLAVLSCCVTDDTAFNKLIDVIFDVEYLVDVIIKFLKVMCCRKFEESKIEILIKFLKKLSFHKQEVHVQLFNMCVKELEVKIAEDNILEKRYKPSVHESSHPYISLLGGKLTGSVKYPGALSLTVRFDELCQTEAGQDVLLFYDGNGRNVSRRHGHMASDWSKTLTISGDELSWMFLTSGPGGLWGFRFTITPTPPSEGWNANVESMSDMALQREPCLLMVKRLLEMDCIINQIRNEEHVLKLVCLLSICIQIKLTGKKEKKWMIDELHAILLSHNAPPIDVPMILNCSRYQDTSVCKMRVDGSRYTKELVLTSSLADFINGVPSALLKQYEYEEVRVRQVEQLQFSSFLRSLALFACSLGLDTLPPCSNKQHWAWFQRYCTAIRTAQSFVQNTPLPKTFASSVRDRISSTLQENEELSLQYEDYEVFDRLKDNQLLNWLNRRTHDWSIVWGGSGTIYAWGHNHRGQLAGIDGAKVKTPTVCNALAALKPVQIVGGEQTLFCVTPDGKVYATGYGSSSRLGLGIQESISTPRMIETIQHITIKKVAVHSGGRHCLALSSDGEVYSWGEGDDGKLGHGNRLSCNTPKLIESIRGINIVNIACGGSHSAAIGENGELYTWGKGRYGRLGHGDGEDQLRPKLVEHLQNYHVIDVACGSGDAQTLCITDNDMVWSWGDGDYGKLGRGGSDGCKIPLVIDYFTCKGIIKVACGSQFSLALTFYGIVYAWGKGDYYRLGNGTEIHIRFPRNLLALESKFVTDIACGSLHCVVCTDEGEVYCWGDNDEGQLGDGTTNPGKMPKQCAILQSKKIDRIACGSAHTIAWSTCAQNQCALPQKIPLEYNHLQGISIATLRNRAFLHHAFSKLLSSCIPLLKLLPDMKCPGGGSLRNEQLIQSLKGSILSHFKENFFRKIIDATMIRDRQHGPIVEINRVTKHRGEHKSGRLKNYSKSVFGQLTKKVFGFPSDNFFLPHRHWKVKFIGESVDDCGGGFSESIAEMCEELQNGTLPLLITTSSHRDSVDNESYDCLIFNPQANTPKCKDMFHFLGILLGIAVRSGNPISLTLAEPMWQLLVGAQLNLADLNEIDRGFVAKMTFLASYDQLSSAPDLQQVSEFDLPFTVRSASGDEVKLHPKQEIVTLSNRHEYMKMALNYKVHEFDQQVTWIRTGMAKVIPVPLLSLFTGAEFENMICGNPDIPVDSFKSITTYRGIEPLAPLVVWFWQALEEFSNHERSLFLRFVWGRTRLPRTALDFKGKDFILQVLDKYNPPDSYLPESYTCFFLLKLPRYSSFEVLREKLKYAIYFCKSIDSDDYARVD